MLVVLPNFSKVIDESLGIMDVTSAFFLKILNKDKNEGEGAVDDIDGEVGEENKYPQEYYVGM